MTIAPILHKIRNRLRPADANGSNSSKDKGALPKAEAPDLLSVVTRDRELGSIPANSSGEDNQATTPSVRSASMDGRAKSANYKRPFAESVDEDEEDSPEALLTSAGRSSGSSMAGGAHLHQQCKPPGEALPDATLGTADPEEHTTSDSHSLERPISQVSQAEQLPKAPSAARITGFSPSETVKTTGSGNRVGITGTYPSNIQNSFKSVRTAGSNNRVGVLPRETT